MQDLRRFAIVMVGIFLAGCDVAPALTYMGVFNPNPEARIVRIQFTLATGDSSLAWIAVPRGTAVNLSPSRQLVVRGSVAQFDSNCTFLGGVDFGHLSGIFVTLTPTGAPQVGEKDRAPPGTAVSDIFDSGADPCPS
jgi:hypothetical protein